MIEYFPRKVVISDWLGTYPKPGHQAWDVSWRNELTEVAGEGGPHLAPQKFLLSQQFRYLMRCKKYLKKNFLSCFVSEIQLFVYIFG